ncbi:MAG TPA: NF038122 family metalloprotease, partial [Blastocatellia bacterium]|nr:NF038122 family metalloprotease [Blastocatellia bacterium]
MDSGKTDFEGVALHELGHALGFTSRVGVTELNSSTSISLTTLDLFRFSSGVTLGTFSTAQRLLSSGGTHNFFDGGALVQFSTGRPDASGGDGRQASHWKDDALNGGQYIGIMDPTDGGSEPMRITAADLRAFEAMGYQVGTQQGGDPCSTAQAITPGQTINGALAGSDCKLDDGSYVDFYTFTGTAGQRIAIGLESNAFDAYLFLLFGQNIVEENDDGGGGTNSRIPANTGFLTLPSSGTYVIAATSYDAGETGNYSLSLTSSGGGGGGPIISVEPASLDFGSVTINSTSDRTLTVRNTGTAALDVTGITSSNSRFSVTSGTSFNVAAGGQQSVTVRFGPTASGAQTGTLSIAGNAGSNPTTVQLRGEGTQPTPTCPTVSGTVTPSSGAIGTSLTITGQNLTGVTQVRFGGGATATPTVNSQGTQIQVTVPSGAQSGTVNLVKAGCQDTPAGSFQVTQAGNCVSVSIAQNLTRPPGAALSVPITVGDLTGKNVTSYDFTLNYNSSVLRPASGEIADRANTLSSGFSVTVNGNNPGRLLVSAFGTSALSGAGTLLNLRFEVIGQAQACSDLTLNGFTLNNGTPCVSATNGRVCLVSGGSLSGTVSYGNSSTAVPGVKLTATGAANATANTDASGNYQLPNLSGGSITVTPTKTDDFNTVKQFIRSADAALVARAAVDLEQLNQFQQVAADANNDRRITGFDAALIAKASVEIFDDSTSVVGMWKFVPDKREYSSIAGEMTGQNYTAVLVGDVNGDWRPATANLAATSDLNPSSHRVEQPAFSVWTPGLKAARGRSAVWPVTVSDLTGLNVTSFDLDIFYDPQELRLHAPAVLTSGTLSAGMNIVVNDAVAGRLRVSAYSVAPLSGGGDLLRLNFIALKDLDDTPAIFWNELRFNDGLPFAEESMTPGAFKNVSAADGQCTEFTA